MNLRQLAENCTGSFGLLHTASIRALRFYLLSKSHDLLVKEIADLKDAASLRAVWEAGVRKDLQEVYFKRLGEIT